MAITLYSIPSIAFSGAPYIISGRSTIINEPNSTNHRIVLTVNFYTYIPPQSLPPTVVATREFVYVLSPKNSSFMFNLSDTLDSMMRQWQTFSIEDGEPVSDEYVKIHMSFVFRESYTRNGQIIHPNTDVNYPALPTLTRPYVIRGYLSDYDRYMHGDWRDLKEETTGDNKFPLTVRPKNGSIYILGEPSHLWYFYSGDVYVSTPPSRVGPWYDINTGRWLNAIAKKTDDMQRLRFVNRFGIVEDALAYAEERKSIGTKSNIISGMRPNSFSAQRNLYKRATPGDTEIELSSGPVNEEWAEWWVTEVLRSERAWLYDEKRNYWMEGVIVPAEKHSIIDRTKSQATVIPFTFRCTMQS